MTEGIFKKRMIEFRLKNKDVIIPDFVTDMLDEAQKEIESCLGSNHYSGSKKRFIRGIKDSEKLVLAIEKWFGYKKEKFSEKRVVNEYSLGEK